MPTEDLSGAGLAAIMRDYLRDVLAADLSPAASHPGSLPRGFWPAGMLEDALADTLMSVLVESRGFPNRL